ncbi:MAG: hypothetical protein JO314_07485 [Acidobacteria bacterium]|nr:hypothetical protein [Acidobacteriota bacterium]
MARDYYKNRSVEGLRLVRRSIKQKILVYPRERHTAHCGACCALVDWVTPDQAAVLLNIGVRKIFRAIENAEIHFVEKSDLVWVCIASVRPMKS